MIPTITVVARETFNGSHTVSHNSEEDTWSVFLHYIDGGYMEFVYDRQVDAIVADAVLTAFIIV